MVAQPLTSGAIASDLLQVIQTNVQALPSEQQRQVLDFVEFLAQKHQPPEPEENRKTIWEIMDERIEQLPDEVWEGSPTDGSYQHDHYLYGTPKRPL